jgi:hypothetical protein
MGSIGNGIDFQRRESQVCSPPPPPLPRLSISSLTQSEVDHRAIQREVESLESPNGIEALGE